MVPKEKRNRHNRHFRNTFVKTEIILTKQEETASELTHSKNICLFFIEVECYFCSRGLNTLKLTA